ncbi:UNVERIFIED_CONTAM: Alcohol dehydrogenase-like 4 [Sesamum angustifolium]|uniref:Alcohol dehydrogenase-like 4 n=1 Tax=Sesamum angustifolium TaxID=2727405 RepID=A0AAW2MJ97_9LAMI
MGSLRSHISADTVGKVITCKAAVAYGAEQPLVVEEVRVDPPQRMEVRIRVLFTSICHTDLSAWQGQNEGQRMYPRILGHEASGVVESVGEGVRELEIGDHVVPIFNGECGECDYCRSEKTNLCEKYRVNPFRGTMVIDGSAGFPPRTANPSTTSSTRPPSPSTLFSTPPVLSRLTKMPPCVQ